MPAASKRRTDKRSVIRQRKLWFVQAFLDQAQYSSVSPPLYYLL
jgi:hypothetical protein